MNTDQIAEEATSNIGLQVFRGGLTPNSYEVVKLIIKAAIEKATDIAFARGVQSERKWARRISEAESRVAHASSQVRDWTVRMGDEQGAHASEEDDTKRLDWLELRFLRNIPATTKSIYFSTNGDLGLREAIDAAMQTAHASSQP